LFKRDTLHKLFLDDRPSVSKICSKSSSGRTASRSLIALLLSSPVFAPSAIRWGCAQSAAWSGHRAANAWRTDADRGEEMRGRRDLREWRCDNKYRHSDNSGAGSSTNRYQGRARVAGEVLCGEKIFGLWKSASSLCRGKDQVIGARAASEQLVATAAQAHAGDRSSPIEFAFDLQTCWRYGNFPFVRSH
jgi:hypothetical protein